MLDTAIQTHSTSVNGAYLCGDNLGSLPTATATNTPSPTATATGTPTAGWRGEYRNSTTLVGPVQLLRYDGPINFQWGTGSPAPSINADGFSVRWSGRLLIPSGGGGTYTFDTVSDDGVRLWINNQLVIDDWTDHPPTDDSVQIVLNGNQYYDIQLQYYENAGGATMQLLWTPPGGSQAILPASQIYPPAPPPTVDELMTGNMMFVYLHTDQLGSVVVATDGTTGAVLSQQQFTAWGQIRNGGISQTTRNYTGQKLDGTGLLYYNTRYYNAALGQFTAPDSLAPGLLSSIESRMGSARPQQSTLTVDFHEKDLLTLFNSHNRSGPISSGPGNIQTLNRYSSMLNNPVRYTDPTGHVPTEAGSKDPPPVHFIPNENCGPVCQYLHYMSFDLDGVQRSSEINAFSPPRQVPSESCEGMFTAIDVTYDGMVFAAKTSCFSSSAVLDILMYWATYAGYTPDLLPEANGSRGCMLADTCSVFGYAGGGANGYWEVNVWSIVELINGQDLAAELQAGGRFRPWHYRPPSP